MHVLELRKRVSRTLLEMPRHECAYVVAGDCLYALGGALYLDNGNYPDRDLESTASAFVCNLRTGGWTRLPDMPLPRIKGTALLVGGTIYLLGGYGSEWLQRQRKGYTLAETVLLNLESQQWARLTVPDEYAGCRLALTDSGGYGPRGDRDQISSLD